MVELIVENDLPLLKLISYLPWLPIFLGLIGNSLCFLIFRFSKEFNKIPSMVYLSFIAIFDTLSLFEWNLNHFLRPNFNFEIEFISLFNCKFLVFLQYYSLQCSGVLLSIMSIDRFFTVILTPANFINKLPFSTVKSAYIWCILISCTLFILNSHILILNGYYNPPYLQNETFTNKFGNETILNQTIWVESDFNNCYKYTTKFELFPTWDSIHMFIYSFIPFVLTLVFNMLLIYKSILFRPKSLDSKNKEAANKKRKLSVSLLSITFAFIALTMPSTLAYGYFYNQIVVSFRHGIYILYFLDFIAFMYHASLFFNCFLTNFKFRYFILKLFLRNTGKKVNKTEVTTRKVSTNY